MPRGGGCRVRHPTIKCFKFQEITLVQKKIPVLENFNQDQMIPQLIHISDQVLPARLFSNLFTVCKHQMFTSSSDKTDHSTGVTRFY